MRIITIHNSGLVTKAHFKLFFRREDDRAEVAEYASARSTDDGRVQRYDFGSVNFHLAIFIVEPRVCARFSEFGHRSIHRGFQVELASSAVLVRYGQFEL